MSRRAHRPSVTHPIPRLSAALLAAAAAAAIGAGCSSGGSGTSGQVPAAYIQACESLCAKNNSCFQYGLDCQKTCTPSASDPHNPNMGNDCDVNALTAKVNECANTSCDNLNTCEDQIDQICGNGGSKDAGTVGSDAGAGVCAVCDKAAACCTATAAQTGGSAAGCVAYSSATCGLGTADQQQLTASICSSVITAGAAANVAACK